MLALTFESDASLNLNMVRGLALHANGSLVAADAEGNIHEIGQADGDRLLLFGRSSEQLSIGSTTGVALYDEGDEEGHECGPRLTLSASNGQLLLRDGDEKRLVAGVGNDGCWWLLGKEGRRLEGAITLLRAERVDPIALGGPRGRLSELAERS